MNRRQNVIGKKVKCSPLKDRTNLVLKRSTGRLKRKFSPKQHKVKLIRDELCMQIPCVAVEQSSPRLPDVSTVSKCVTNITTDCDLKSKFQPFEKASSMELRSRKSAQENVRMGNVRTSQKVVTQEITEVERATRKTKVQQRQSCGSRKKSVQTIPNEEENAVHKVTLVKSTQKEVAAGINEFNEAIRKTRAQQRKLRESREKPLQEISKKKENTNQVAFHKKSVVNLSQKEVTTKISEFKEVTKKTRAQKRKLCEDRENLIDDTQKENENPNQNAVPQKEFIPEISEFKEVTRKTRAQQRNLCKGSEKSTEDIKKKNENPDQELFNKEAALQKKLTEISEFGGVTKSTRAQQRKLCEDREKFINDIQKENENPNQNAAPQKELIPEISEFKEVTKKKRAQQHNLCKGPEKSTGDIEEKNENPNQYLFNKETAPQKKLTTKISEFGGVTKNTRTQLRKLREDREKFIDDIQKENENPNQNAAPQKELIPKISEFKEVAKKTRAQQRNLCKDSEKSTGDIEQKNENPNQDLFNKETAPQKKLTTKISEFGGVTKNTRTQLRKLCEDREKIIDNTQKENKNTNQDALHKGTKKPRVRVQQHKLRDEQKKIKQEIEKKNESISQGALHKGTVVKEFENELTPELEIVTKKTRAQRRKTCESHNKDEQEIPNTKQTAIDRTMTKTFQKGQIKAQCIYNCRNRKKAVLEIPKENTEEKGENIPEKKLRKLAPVNYRDTSGHISANEDSTKEQNNSVYVPVYRRKLDNDEFPNQKENVYEFFLDEKEKKKRKKRVSDTSFKVKLPKSRNKVTWTKKAKEVLERLGLNVSSKTLKEDVEQLIKAKNNSQNKSVINVASSSEAQSDSVQPSSTNKINIISHITIPPSSESRRQSFESTSNDSLDNFPEIPAANSTMINNKELPWRLPSPARYNPHFLKVKTNALPYVDQDIILDSTFTKPCSNITVNVPAQEEKATQTQQSILNYVNGSQSISSNGAVQKTFDDTTDCYGLFTGYTNCSDKASSESENKLNSVLVNSKNSSSSERYNRKANSTIENDENIPPNNQRKSDDIENCFGFISIEEENIIEKPVTKGGNSNTIKAKPTRIPVVMLINILKKVNENEVTFIDEYSRYSGNVDIDKKTISSESESESGDKISNEDEKPEVPLFVDLEMKIPNRSYQRKYKKQQKCLVFTEESDINYDDFKHTDKKTKKEWTNEAEKWAEQFNSVCQEVENYELEIE